MEISVGKSSGFPSARRKKEGQMTKAPSRKLPEILNNRFIATHATSDIPPGYVAASVIIVTYNTRPELLEENLTALYRQYAGDFEGIVIDNSDTGDLEPIIRGFPVHHYIKLTRNYGLAYARNLGIRISHGDIVVFLDDDAVPDCGFVEKHLTAHRSKSIAGLRGKALPRTRSIYNELASSYDLGNRLVPWYINLEGNSSFRRDLLVELGGFDSRITGAGGHEGLELSYRIIKYLGDRRQLIYHPGPVIRHDFCRSFHRYYRKVVRHRDNFQRLAAEIPDLREFRDSYRLPEQQHEIHQLSSSRRLRLWFIKNTTEILWKLRRVRTGR
jgi:GT2 family glycosyltransferase